MPSGGENKYINNWMIFLKFLNFLLYRDSSITVTIFNQLTEIIGK